MKNEDTFTHDPARWLVCIDKETLRRVRSLCKETGFEQGKFATRVFNEFFRKPDDEQRKIMVGLNLN